MPDELRCQRNDKETGRRNDQENKLHRRCRCGCYCSQSHLRSGRAWQLRRSCGEASMVDDPVTDPPPYGVDIMVPSKRASAVRPYEEKMREMLASREMRCQARLFYLVMRGSARRGIVYSKRRARPVAAVLVATGASSIHNGNPSREPHGPLYKVNRQDKTRHGPVTHPSPWRGARMGK